MRFAVVVTGVAVVVVAIALPWYRAFAVDGSSVMAGWGGWSVSEITADLTRFPVAVLIWIPAAVMLVAAVREQYGLTALAASAVAALGWGAYALRDVFASHTEGGGAVYVEVLSGPRWVVTLGLLAGVLGWFLYSRVILRARATS